MANYYTSSRSEAYKREKEKNKYTVGSSGTSAAAQARDARRNVTLGEMGITTTNTAPKTTTPRSTANNSGYVSTYGGNSLYTGAGNTAPAAPKAAANNSGYAPTYGSSSLYTSAGNTAATGLPDPPALPGARPTNGWSGGSSGSASFDDTNRRRTGGSAVYASTIELPTLRGSMPDLTQGSSGTGTQTGYAKQKSSDEIKTELQQIQKLQTAKQQELETFYAQNRMVLNAEGLFGSATDRHVAEVKSQRETLRAELRELEDQVAKLNDELFQARQNDWGSMAQNEDFEKYVQIGADMQNPTWEAVNDPANIDPLSSPEERSDQVGNIVTFSMENKDALEYATKRDVGNAAYTFMTDEEMGIYNYVLGKYGKKTAQIYLDSLENKLNSRYGAETAKQYTNIENPFWRTVASMPYGFAAGVDQFASGVKQLFHEEELPVTPMQYASQTIQQNLGKSGQIAYGVSNVVGNILPSMLIGKGAGAIGSALGMSTKGAGILASAGSSAAIGASSAGNVYTQALREGYSKQQAKTYTALVSASAAGLSFLLSGVGKLQGVSETKLLSKVRTLDSTLAKMALTGVIKVGGEVLEEELQLQLEPLFRTIVFDEEYEAPSGEEMLQTALIAALSTGVVEGPAVLGIEIDFGKLGQLVMQNPASRETVANALESSRAGSKAAELAQNLIEQSTAGKPLSNEDIGKLYTIVQVDTQTGKTVKAEDKTTELLHDAMELPTDSQAHQLAVELSEQLDTTLTELGIDASEQYQLPRADQAKLIEQVTDKTLSDQTVGELARLVEAESADARDQYHKIFARGTSKLQQGISAFSPEDPLYKNAQAVKPDGDKFDVAMHGAPTSVAFGGHESNMSPRTLAAIIRHSEGYHGQDIRLLACSTGVQNDGNYCFAEELANALGVTVWAPNDVLYIAQNGSIKVGKHGTGEFVSYEPNERRRIR